MHITRTIDNLVNDLQVSSNYRGSELLGVLQNLYRHLRTYALNIKYLKLHSTLWHQL